MKRSFLLFLVLLCVGFVGVAQDSKVTTGIIAYDQMRFDEAIIKFKEALGKPELLKPKSIAKANYYLAQSLYKVMTSKELRTKMEAQFPNIEEATFDAYKKAMETLKDAGGDKSSFTTGLDFIKQNMFVAMLNEGSKLYSSVKDDSPEGKATLTKAAGFLEKSLEIDANNYLPELVLGFIGLRMNDDASAMKHLEKSIALHEDKTKTLKVDSSMINAYLSLSAVYLDQKNTAKALDAVEKGKKAFVGNPDLAKQELAVYQSDPAYLEKALGKFKESLDKNPKDATVRTAYADMLTRSGKPEEGINEYKKVLESDPNNFYANANLGAHFVNTAAAINEELKKPDSDYEKLNGQIVENFKLAYPYIKKAQELKPKEIEWVQQMIQITSYLMIQDDKMEAEMTKYNELKKQMQGQ